MHMAGMSILSAATIFPTGLLQNLLLSQVKTCYMFAEQIVELIEMMLKFVCVYTAQC